MFKHAIMATALTAFATPAFAQVTATDSDQMEEGVEMMKDGAEMAEDGAEMVEDATDGMEMDGMEMDGMATMDSTTAVADTAVLDATTGEVVTVTESCPEGSTAQPDGTCMMAADAELPE